MTSKGSKDGLEGGAPGLEASACRSDLATPGQDSALEHAKVVFLDIDGPMIPTSMYLINRMCSYERQFPATTVAVINHLCASTGAKIVFNTTHNRPMAGVPDIGPALVASGLDATHIHPDAHTTYPDLRRMAAIENWLAAHPEVTDWIALDDSRFTEDERLIWVHPDEGLHVGHLNEASKRLGGKPFLVLI